MCGNIGNMAKGGIGGIGKGMQMPSVAPPPAAPGAPPAVATTAAPAPTLTPGVDLGELLRQVIFGKKKPAAPTAQPADPQQED
jgi:hypothetical protein